jgi:hypothetical protein
MKHAYVVGCAGLADFLTLSGRQEYRANSLCSPTWLVMPALKSRTNPHQAGCASLFAFRYKMRLVYAHFPINANAESGGKELSIRNFLGEKVVRHIPMGEGVIVKKDVDVKDQLLFEGNNIEHVSRCVLLLVTIVFLLARSQRVVMLW